MPHETTTMAEESQQFAIEPPAPTTKIWYPYVPLIANSKLMVYSGSSVELPIENTPPENSSEYPPPIPSSGEIAYHDGIGWVLGPDVRAMDLSVLQNKALLQVNAQFAYAIEQLKNGKYFPEEQESWNLQLSEAEQVLTGKFTSSLLQTLADARGITVKEMAQSIVDKADSYNKAYFLELASMQAKRESIKSAKTLNDITVFESVHDLR